MHTSIASTPPRPPHDTAVRPGHITWNPWHGCHKISEGCRHCYVYRQDTLFERNAAVVHRTAAFNLPVRRSRDGRFQIPSGTTVLTCFTSDLLLPEADAWRPEVWEMMRLRHDLHFVFFTKRIDRLASLLPPDWGEGYDHVTIGCTVETQAMADRRLPIFGSLPIRHKWVICAPLLGPVDLSAYLDGSIEEVTAGGESGSEARICDFAWVLALRRQCIEHRTPFTFHQTGARLQKGGRVYRIPRSLQREQARRAGIDYMPADRPEP